MAKTNKPLWIMVDRVLHEKDTATYDKLTTQGHAITIMFSQPDIVISPTAMRVTCDMVEQFPNTVSLAIKGAQALKQGPKSTNTTAWKTKKGKPHAKKADTKGEVATKPI